MSWYQFQASKANFLDYLKRNLSALLQEPLLLGLVLLWVLLRLLNVVKKIVNENQQIEVRILKDVIIIKKGGAKGEDIPPGPQGNALIHQEGASVTPKTDSLMS